MVVDLSLFYLGSDPCSVFSCLCLGDPSPGGRTMMKRGVPDGGLAENERMMLVQDGAARTGVILVVV